ncbi:MAG TPA: amphi-Trp domain-containing protein [bacterium]|nr:amphi-Trp domain-containing protein [bacterium]
MSQSLKMAAKLPNTDVAEMMNQLSLGLMHGAIVIRNSGKRHAYHPGQVISVEIRADEDSGKGEMHIELRWRVPLSVTTAP